MNNREVALMLFYCSKRMQSELASFLPALKSTCGASEYEVLRQSIAELVFDLEEKIAVKICEKHPDFKEHYQERLEASRRGDTD
jgi:hypothetical protein